MTKFSVGGKRREKRRDCFPFGAREARTYDTFFSWGEKGGKKEGKTVGIFSPWSQGDSNLRQIFQLGKKEGKKEGIFSPGAREARTYAIFFRQEKK